MMKMTKVIISVLICILTVVNLYADEADKTGSPYFYVNSSDPETDALPLQSTSADVSIAGVIADVTVTQVYKNEGKNALECKYVFPGSTRAAVYALRMTIGERTIVAQIRKKAEARQEYEQAKQEGKRASLLEQSRPNVFEMNVANIMPGDVIKVELQYTELLVPTDGVYQFIYPTVVGPRYTDQLLASNSSNIGHTASPYLKAGTLAPYDFDIKVGIQAGMPIRDVKVKTHKTAITYPDVTQANIKLDASETTGGNRDYVIEYRLKGGEIESGLLLYEGKKENFFLMMVQPPKKVEPKHIPPREYIFIVDVSGSMRGFPLNISKKLLRNLIVNLRPTDMFNVMLFSGGSQVLASQSLPATEVNVQKAVQLIDNTRGGGSTRLLPAMQRAIELPRSEGLSRSMVIVTDGYVSCEPEAFELIRTSLNKSNCFSFGIGSSVNRHLIDGLANVGMGEPLVILDQEGADEKAEKFRQYINSPVLTQVHVDFKGFEAYDVEPISVPDVMANRPVVVFGKYKGDAAGSITLKGYAGGRKKYRKTFNVSQTKAHDDNAALRYLWARKRIQRLDDYQKLDPYSSDQEMIDEVTQLGLDYNLLTAYTSFVAIDNRVVNKDGNRKFVKQALPLPQGVPNSAVGFDMNIGGVSKHTKALAATTAPVYVAQQIRINGQANSSSALHTAITQKVAQLKIRLTTQVNITFTVSPSGKIENLNITGKNLNPLTLIRLKAATKAWTFTNLTFSAAQQVQFSIPVTK